MQNEQVRISIQRFRKVRERESRSQVLHCDCSLSRLQLQSQRNLLWHNLCLEEFWECCCDVWPPATASVEDKRVALVEIHEISQAYGLALVKVQDPNKPGFYTKIYSDMLAFRLLWFGY